jgi:hypothetical protein
MRYASQRDPQLVGLLRRAAALFVLAAVGLAITAWRLHSDLLAMLGIVCLAFGAGSLWTLRATWYEITVDRLRIRCGPSRLAIPLESLQRITPCVDRRNAPALSFDRLRVEDGKAERPRTVFIAPQPRLRFLEHLCAAARLEPAGHNYVRAAGTPASPNDLPRET